MDTFKAYMLRKAYQKIQKLGDKLAKIEPLIDWEAFRPIIAGLYHNQGPQEGRRILGRLLCSCPSRGKLVAQVYKGFRMDIESSRGRNQTFNKACIKYIRRKVN